MFRFWNELPVRVDLKNANLPRIASQLHKWQNGQVDLTEIDDEAFASIYFKHFYESMYHKDAGFLQVFEKEKIRRESSGPIGAEVGRGSFIFKDLNKEELEIRAKRANLILEMLKAVYRIQNDDFYFHLDAVGKLLENLSDDEIAELCAVITDPFEVEGSIWKEVVQVGLDRSSRY